MKSLALSLIVLLAGCVVYSDPLPPPSSGGGAKARHDVVLCHKGKKTMTLPAEAADAHIGHGDRYGSC